MFTHQAIFLPYKIAYSKGGNEMFRSIVLAACAITAVSIAAQSVMGQDQFINCRKFADNITITIDGDPSDWPLSSYGNPATLPDLDEAEQFSDTSSTNAIIMVPMTTGDHFVYDPKKALINAGGIDSFELEGEGDFEATTYIGWNDEGFYVLNMVQDNLIGWFHGQSVDRDVTNQSAWTNDGIELWFDNDNDRFPLNINTDPTSPFDLQLDISIDDAVIREEFDIDSTMANGLPLEISIFRSALNTEDEAEKEILDQIAHVTKLDDKPAGEHTSYIQEIMLPWNVFPNFEPTHPIGFNVNWVDWDDQVFQLMRWAQINESDVQYFREMRFTSDNPLGGTDIRHWPIH